MASKKRFYAVARGLEGVKIYDTWEQCAPNVIGVKNSRYKSFPNKDEAAQWIQLILATEQP